MATVFTCNIYCMSHSTFFPIRFNAEESIFKKVVRRFPECIINRSVNFVTSLSYETMRLEVNKSQVCMGYLALEISLTKFSYHSVREKVIRKTLIRY